MQALTPQLKVSQSHIYATNSGLFVDDGAACLIDPGITPAEIAALAAQLEEEALDPRALILTHGHWDHLLGPEHFPGVKVVAHAAYLKVLDQHGEDLQRQIAQWEAQMEIRRERPFILPRPDFAFSSTLQITVGQTALELHHAPGHAPDALVIYHPESGLLWAGDMLSDVEIPYVSDDLTAYEETLAYLAKLDVRALVPGHGNPTTERTEIKRRLRADRTYLTELRSRVAAVVALGYSLEETLTACAEISIHHPEINAGPHRLNVESVYVALGGEADPAQVGWSQEWTET